MAAAPTSEQLYTRLLLPRGTDPSILANVTHLNGYGVRDRGVAHARDVYLDTATLTLARHGLALQLRRDGRRWLATVKWEGTPARPAYAPPQVPVLVSFAPAAKFSLPDGPLRVHLSALTAGRPLVPILIARVHRRRLDVLRVRPAATTTAEEAVAEITLERVRLVDPQQQRALVTYGELGIEARAEPHEFAALAALLQRRFGWQASHDSQLARGLAILHGPGVLGGTEPPQPGPAADLAEAMRMIVAKQLWRWRQHDPGVRVGESVEALHNLRVAVRRLRAAVRLFHAGFQPRLRDHLEQELSWLGQSLGPARDLDVQLTRLAEDRPAATAPGAAATLAALKSHLEDERRCRRAEMLTVLDSRRYFRLLVRLERYGLGQTRPPRSARAPEALPLAGCRALERAAEQLLKRGRKLERSGAVPQADDLHALRIRAKRLRYLFEFLTELTGKPGRRFVKRLTRLQDLLGAHHDTVVAADLLRRYAEGPGAQAGTEGLLFLGQLIGNELRLAEDARLAFRSTWRRFARKRTLAEFRDVLDRLREEGRTPAIADPPSALPATVPSREAS